MWVGPGSEPGRVGVWNGEKSPGLFRPKQCLEAGWAGLPRFLLLRPQVCDRDLLSNSSKTMTHEKTKSGALSVQKSWGWGRCHGAKWKQPVSQWRDRQIDPLASLVQAITLFFCHRLRIRVAGLGESQGNSKCCKSRACAPSIAPGDLVTHTGNPNSRGCPRNKAQDREGGVPPRGQATMIAV